MNESFLTREPGAVQSAPQDNFCRLTDEDSRVWDILGRVEFSADAPDSPVPVPTLLQGSDAEGEEEANVWDILGRVEFSDN
jgi:hypothetical protein